MGTLEENTAQVEAASTKYKTGATGTPVQTDQNARMALDDTPKTAVANADDGTTLNQSNYTVAGEEFPVYTGGNRVTGVTPTAHESIVVTALSAGTVFAKGGQIPPTDYVSAANASAYVDPLTLIEASKLTGEKFF